MKRIKKGFTIVELVIVIGVIGILSAILIPTFVNLTDSAKEAARKSDVAGAYSQYVFDITEAEGTAEKQSDVYANIEGTTYWYEYDGEWKSISAPASSAYVAGALDTVEKVDFFKKVA